HGLSRDLWDSELSPLKSTKSHLVFARRNRRKTLPRTPRFPAPRNFRPPTRAAVRRRFRHVPNGRDRASATAERAAPILMSSRWPNSPPRHELRKDPGNLPPGQDLNKWLPAALDGRSSG